MVKRSRDQSRTRQAAELLKDDPAELFLPQPHPLQERLAPWSWR